MISRGIRIYDSRKETKHMCVALSDLLLLVKESHLNWGLLWLDGQPKLEHAEYIIDLEPKVNKSPNGLICSWDFLFELANKFFQEFDLLIIGSKSVQNLHRYQDDQEMYETCDVVIEIIDGSYWEIFSSDPELIAKLKAQFHETEPLDVDFQKKQY